MRNRKSKDLTVGALHFFKHDDQRLSDARLCIYSIANQLANLVPGLGERLESLERSELEKENLKTLFRHIIIEPCSGLNMKSRVVVVLDALDECNPNQRKELLDIIQQCWINETPEWLGILVSTRPEDYIPYKLKTSVLLKSTPKMSEI